MLYWSSLIIEENLKTVRIELDAFKADTVALGQAIKGQALKTNQASQSSHSDPKYPNLLKEDPYFSQTLPSLVGEGFQPKGILREAILGRPDNLHPFNGFRDVASLYRMCTVNVADLQFGKYETLSPQMAVKIEARPRSDIPEIDEYWVHLRNDVYWQPLNRAQFNFELTPQFSKKQPVTAHDFKFFYDALMNPYLSEAKAVSLRTYYNDVEDFIVIDDYTFVIRWKPHKVASENDESLAKIKYTSLSLTGALSPLPCFVYKYFADGHKIIEEDEDPDCYRNDSVWAQNFAEHWAKNYIVSCGPFSFEKITEEGIHLKRNAEHFNPYAVLIKGIQYRFKESSDAVWQDFKAGHLDLCTLPASQLLNMEAFLKSADYQVQKKQGLSIESLNYIDLSYFYLGWNLANPVFESEKVRLAMTMTIDRERIIDQNLNQMGVPTTGPFFCFSPAYDSSIDPWPYNPEFARRLLDQEGWIDRDGDGIREKVIRGKTVPFRFKLFYYVKNLPTKVIAEYISTALREVGVECELCGLDIADLSRQLDDKSFDAIFMGWKLGTPPEDPYQLWHSSGAKEKGSSNVLGFSNPEVDQIIEALRYEYDKTKRIQLYHRFHRIVHEKAPCIFLYTPKALLLSREYVKNLFIPLERQDLIPGANIPEPNTQVIWLADHD